MYCRKCGNALKDGAKKCDFCNEIVVQEKGSRNTSKITGLVLAITAFIAVVTVCIVVLTMLFSAQKKTEFVLVDEDSKLSVSETSGKVAELVDADNEDRIEDSIEDKEGDLSGGQSSEEEPVSTESETSKGQIKELGEAGESTLILPSLESYSKERLSAKDYIEDKLYACIVIEFTAQAGDSQIVQCMGEYQSTLAEYGLEISGTTSFDDDKGYHCTSYTFNYTGDKDISKGSIVPDYGPTCDICFVTAVKDDLAKIIAYIPENVQFDLTRDKMKNSY